MRDGGGVRKRLSASGDSCARRTALLGPTEAKHEAVGLAAHSGIEDALAEIVGGVAQQIALGLEHEARRREVALTSPGSMRWSVPPVSAGEPGAAA